VQEIAPEHAYFKHANRGYLDWGIEKGIRMSAEPTIFQLYSEPLQRFRLAAQGHGDRQPPDRARGGSRPFDPLPFWYPPFEGEMVDGTDFPLHAVTQRPMHMYHSWGSQNAWLRQITAENRLYIHRDLGRSIGVWDERLGLVASHLGRIKCQVRLMDGVNPHTVWTWNAIGKRGRLEPRQDAPEATRGFLLNHLISELLPEGGRRLPVFELRPDHGSGGLVRPARVDRKGRWRGNQRAAIRGAGPPGLPGPDESRLRVMKVERDDQPARNERRRSSASSSTSTPASAARPA
jgi:hypothetical protein